MPVAMSCYVILELFGCKGRKSAFRSQANLLEALGHQGYFVAREAQLLLCHSSCQVKHTTSPGAPSDKCIRPHWQSKGGWLGQMRSVVSTDLKRTNWITRSFHTAVLLATISKLKVQRCEGARSSCRICVAATCRQVAHCVITSELEAAPS